MKKTRGYTGYTCVVSSAYTSVMVSTPSFRKTVVGSLHRLDSTVNTNEQRLVQHRKLE